MNKKTKSEMENPSDFLTHFNITQQDFESTGLVWEDLLKIRDDYEKFKLELTAPANYLIERFHDVNAIHSVRYRIKDVNHLIEKIIRKKIEEPGRVVDMNNYRSEITDLIGLRALHLFKNDWVSIHTFIKETWNLKENPIAYYRSGDSPEIIQEFENLGCKVKEHPYGYRSVHYLVETSPSKTTYISEVQVRTIFEEGWSEIDHKIRYPYDRSNGLLSQFLVMFNRLSGNADEMGSYVKYLKQELDFKEKEFKDADEKKISIIADLKKTIKELKLAPKVVTQWEIKLDEVLNLSKYSANNFQVNMPNFSKIDLSAFNTLASAGPKIDLSALKTLAASTGPKIDLSAFNTLASAGPKIDLSALNTLVAPAAPKVDLPVEKTPVPPSLPVVELSDNLTDENPSSQDKKMPGLKQRIKPLVAKKKKDH